MKLALKIVALLSAAAVVFVVSSMIEAWTVFEPWLRGAPPAVSPPQQSTVQEAIEAYTEAVNADHPAAARGSPAWLANHHDRAFRARHQIVQELEQLALAVENVTALSPTRTQVTTREAVRLTIGRPGGSLRRYRLAGTWQYTLALADGQYEVFEALPLDVALDDAPAENDGP